MTSSLSRGHLLEAPASLSAGAQEERLASPAGAAQGILAARYGRRDYLMRRLLLLADACGIMVGLLAAAHVEGRADVGRFLLLGAATLPVWVLVFKLYGLYDRDVKRVSHTAVDDVPWLFHALLIGALLLWFSYKVLPVEQLVLAEAVVFAFVAVPTILVARAGVRRSVRRRFGRERVLLIGEDRMAGVLMRKIRHHPEYGMDPVGLLQVAGSGNGSVDLPAIGALDDFQDAVKEHRIERIIVSHTGLDETTVLDLLRRAKELSLKVSVLPQMFDVMGPSVEIDDVEGVTVLALNPPILPRSSRALKRSMDLVGAGALLVLLFPLLAAIALAIRLDSKGPVLFRQERIGRGGRRFHLVKFRTMVHGAESRAEELMADSRDEYWLNLERDPRITRIGRVLRITSLDELPQLWNVVRGQMSLVGPRPLVESEDRLIAGWARTRLDLMPGITGSWQVLGRTNIPFEEMVKLDYLYVTNWSLWTDVRLLLHTLPAVLTRRGAN
jgi:exopolysaccharide biosynthesis polyprenyl glycosylphosphotransferase